jgi:hypothetical protein
MQKRVVMTRFWWICAAMAANTHERVIMTRSWCGWPRWASVDGVGGPLMVVVAENAQTSRYDSFVVGVCDGGVPLMVVVAGNSGCVRQW